MTIGSLVVANSVLGGLVLHQQTGGGDLAAAVPLPAISFEPPEIAAPPAQAAQRAQRQRAKPRPPVLLGPENLADALSGFCTDKRDAGPALLDGGNWRCGAAGPFVDMDSACRWMYDADAWAGMIDDTDPQTWRCYHDAS